jgi:hypothetical protein
MQAIIPNLWFDTEAEAAANFYTSIFPDAKVVNVTHYGEAGPRPAGLVMTVTFRLLGQEFTALNGGPDFTFNESISFLVSCDSWSRQSLEKSSLLSSPEPEPVALDRPLTIPLVRLEVLRSRDPPTRLALSLLCEDLSRLEPCFEFSNTHHRS